MVMIVSVDSISFVMQARYFIDGHHSGNMLNGALNVLHGEPLFSRVMSIYGLLLPYLNALQLYMFGETYLSLWVLPVIAFSIGLAVYYSLFSEFLERWQSLLAVFIILALNNAVLLPWSNYIAFGLNALLVWLLSRNIEGSGSKFYALFGIGALLFISVLIRSQAILLYPVFLAVLFIYCRDSWLRRAGALSFGLFVLFVCFVLKLAYDGTLRDYYLQTIVIQDHYYFGGRGPLFGLSQVFEVFATGHSPAGAPIAATGFAPYAALLGGLWLCLFLVSAYVVIQFSIQMLSAAADKNRLRAEVSPTVLLIAMLTAIGPVFSIHNVWDNFRYALHIAQGIGIVFYCINRIIGREHSGAIILALTFFFFAPLYSLAETTKSSATYLLARAQNNSQIKYAKYFEGIELPAGFRDRLIFANNFFESYFKKYPDSYIFTDVTTITDGVYAIGKFPTYDKTLTNDQFVSTFWLYYPEFATKFDQAARSRKLIFLSSSGGYTGLNSYDYVKFYEIHGLSIFIARERAENLPAP